MNLGWLRHRSLSARRRSWLFAPLALLLLLSTPSAAEVSHEGEWPKDEPVTLSVHGKPRAETIRELARKAGWNLVAQDLGDDPVEVEVRNEAPSKVLELLLADGQYVARREGNLVSISKQPPTELAAPEPAASAAPKAAAVPEGKKAAPGKYPGNLPDRFVAGTLHLRPEEVVHSIVVFGGDVTIEGTVTRDVVAFGGKVRILNGGYVMHDVFTFGGVLDLENGARVDGDVGRLGGSLKRGEKVEIGGDVNEDELSGDDRSEQSQLTRFFGKLVGNLAGAAILWVFGALMLAFAARRLEILRSEVVGRPLKSLVFGAFSLFVALVLFIALCVTLIGIPVAVLGAILFVLGVYVATCAVLLTAGRALAERRTKNPYTHLALGCFVYFLLGSIPFAGPLLKIAATFIGVGALVLTRGAGLLPPRGAAQAAARSPEGVM